jgi:hypothetical protein
VAALSLPAAGAGINHTRPGAAEEPEVTITTSTIPALRDVDGLAVIGRTKHALMGIRYADDEGGGEPGPKPETPPGNEQPKPGPPAEPEPIEGSDDGGKTFTPAYVEKLRKEAAKNRVEDKAAIQKQIDEAVANGQKAWAAKLGKDLGILEADSEKTPEEIIAELQKERDEAKAERDQFAAERSATREREAIKTAAEANKGNPRLVAAVIREDGLLKDIDPTADDYAAQVAAVVKAEIEKDASLLAVQVAPRSGSENAPDGTPNPGGPKTTEELIKERRKRRGF